MKSTIKLLTILLLISSISRISAQDSDPSKTRPLQISFAYPLGTSGVNSPDYTNNFSLNILYGINGGVDGVEIGGIFNVNKGDAKWVQLASVFNLNGGETRGAQLAGVFNINGKETSGLQLASIFNINGSETRGFQASTINLVFSDFNGFQLGVANYSKNLHGLQLGVVNVSENSEQGIPIGILSIVKNGHYELEATGGDVLYMNINYKMGVEKFYTIFKTGFSSFNNIPVFSYGMGFGGLINFSEQHKLSIDISGNQIVYNDQWSREKINMLNKIDFNYKFSILPNFTLLIGPSVNVYITQEIVNGSYNTLNLLYTIYSRETSDTNVSMWIGANAGLSYKF